MASGMFYINTTDGDNYEIPCQISFFENGGNDATIGYISYYDYDADVIEALSFMNVIEDEYVVCDDDEETRYTTYDIMYNKRAEDKYGNGLIQY